MNVEQAERRSLPTVHEGVIDVHAHWLPENLFRLPPGSPLPPLEVRSGELHLGELPLSIEGAAMSDPARVLADTEAAGLGARVLSAPPFAFPVVDHRDAHDYVTDFNERLTQVCRDSDGRLLGLGLVSLHDPEQARLQLKVLATSGVIRGVAVPPLVGGTTFDRGPLYDVARMAAELDLAVLVHPMQLPREEWGSYYLANLIGNPVETGTAVAACVLGGVLERVPGLRICFVHGGGCAPALLGRWRHGWERRADVRAADSADPAVGFRGLYFDTLTHDGGALRLLVEHAGTARLACGSDYPFDMGVTRPLDLPVGEGIASSSMERAARDLLGLTEMEE